MVKVDEGELLHGFAREREGVWGEWEGEREREQRGAGEVGSLG